MTLTFKLDLHSLKTNQNTKYVNQRLFSSKVIARSPGIQSYAHIGQIAPQLKYVVGKYNRLVLTSHTSWLLPSV